MLASRSASLFPPPGESFPCSLRPRSSLFTEPLKTYMFGLGPGVSEVFGCEAQCTRIGFSVLR